MWDLTLDVSSIGSDQRCQPYGRIKDPHGASLSNERLHERHHRALAKVVCFRLERESDNAYPLPARTEDQFDPSADLMFVRRGDRGKERYVDVGSTRGINQSSEILRET